MSKTPEQLAAEATLLDQRKIKAFSAHVDSVAKPAFAALDGTFVALFVIGESDGMTIAQLKTNVETPRALLEHCRKMIDTMLDDSVPTTDLRDTGGTQH